MKAAILGSGNIANAHAEALRSSGVELAAVVSNRLESAESFSKKWNVPVFDNDLAILLKNDIQSVHICTPPNHHYTIAKQLIENGKHVLCEKPLCLNDDEAYDLVRLARSSHVVTALGLNVRYMPAVEKAKKTIQSQEFGAVRLVHGSYLQQFGILPVPYSWRFKQDSDVKMRTVTEIGTHWLDLVQYLCEMRITRVSALFDFVNPIRFVDEGITHGAPIGKDSMKIEIQTEDIALLQFQFSNGSFGSVILSQVSAGRENHLEIEIVGAGKSLWWDAETPNVLSVATKNGGISKEIFPFGNNGFNDSIRMLVQDFYTTIHMGQNSRPSNLPDFDDGAYLCKLCNAVYQSAASDGAWQTVDERF